ncbi:TetR/AcrR family transcriptional regulator [Lysobacter solisilvae (ex Woo and Kim 2020)]|uniref:TetR/AcrR family transcriptional regulator n=1 Tax=Agrilutibacter terrestris TaxID=2865112 RepID=A0A7H0FYI5_9GAMM|nr:TetR/AcrR family transcriptional regulator [Lysobacter terrestris]QNP41101.1 TetR/AcrR family transcriptional regulator [Lysobacter terrestris]
MSPRKPTQPPREPTAPGTGRRPRAPRKRTPGRPTGEGPDLRARVLDAAIACFVRQGIAATSLRAIAAEAHVTPALLHYYFGDKEQLVGAVLQERVMPAFDVVREAVLAAADDDIAGLVAGYVRGVSQAVSLHPWLPALWVREVLCEGGALREAVFNQVAPMPVMIAQRLAAAQARGQINADLDPRLLVISLVGLTLFPAAGAPIWRRIFEASDIGVDAMRDHTLALLDHGLGLAGSPLKDRP